LAISPEHRGCPEPVKNIGRKAQKVNESAEKATEKAARPGKVVRTKRTLISRGRTVCVCVLCGSVGHVRFCVGV
jgi:hypothetical protein